MGLTEKLNPTKITGGPRRRMARRRWWKIVVAAVIFAGLAFTADVLIGVHQKRVIEARRAAQQRTERMAWFELRADIADVTYTADGRYRVNIWMENVFPEHNMYLMVPSMRAFVQVGPTWREVPVTEVTVDPRLREGTVVHLDRRITVDWIMDVPKGPEYFQLLPGYLHVQFQNTMFVSAVAEPKEQIAERNDYYYVHLRPFGANDAYLSRVNDFPGRPPVWIPMPPH